MPTDWQEQAYKALKDFHSKGEGPAWGLIFPKAWAGELRPFATDGQLRRMFSVKSVALDGKKGIVVIGEPEEPKS